MEMPAALGIFDLGRGRPPATLALARLLCTYWLGKCHRHRLTVRLRAGREAHEAQELAGAWQLRLQPPGETGMDAHVCRTLIPMEPYFVFLLPLWVPNCKPRFFIGFLSLLYASTSPQIFTSLLLLFPPLTDYTSR